MKQRNNDNKAVDDPRSTAAEVLHVVRILIITALLAWAWWLIPLERAQGAHSADKCSVKEIEETWTAHGYITRITTWNGPCPERDDVTRADVAVTAGVVGLALIFAITERASDASDDHHDAGFDFMPEPEPFLVPSGIGFGFRFRF